MANTLATLLHLRGTELNEHEIKRLAKCKDQSLMTTSKLALILAFPCSIRMTVCASLSKIISLASSLIAVINAWRKPKASTPFVVS